MTELALLAGSAAAAVFMASQLPMLIKAWRTKDLASYSFAQIGLANLGNLLYTGYVASVPIGPLWALHGFNLVTTVLMLVWYLRHGRAGRGGSGLGVAEADEPGPRTRPRSHVAEADGSARQTPLAQSQRPMGPAGEAGRARTSWKPMVPTADPARSGRRGRWVRPARQTPLTRRTGVAIQATLV